MMLSESNGKMRIVYHSLRQWLLRSTVSTWPIVLFFLDFGGPASLTIVCLTSLLSLCPAIPAIFKHKLWQLMAELIRRACKLENSVEFEVACSHSPNVLQSIKCYQVDSINCSQLELFQLEVRNS